MGETQQVDFGRTWNYRLLDESNVKVDSLEFEDDSTARVWALKRKIDKGLWSATLECFRDGRWQFVWDKSF
jgi:hypothetical protein